MEGNGNGVDLLVTASFFAKMADVNMQKHKEDEKKQEKQKEKEQKEEGGREE